MAAIVREETDECLAIWRHTPDRLPVLGPASGVYRRFGNARAATRLIDELAAQMVRYPDEPVRRRDWQDAIRGSVRRFGEERLGWPAGYRRLLFADDFFKASVAFARETRAFNPGFRSEDLLQALRNVWISNSLQTLLGLPVSLSPALFAYSMLYPLSDNLLDDPETAAKMKRRFNGWFAQRLAGVRVTPRNLREAAIHCLVGRIEEAFPRSRFPAVYESLLAIHAAQAQSLRQQDDPGLPEDDLLLLTFTKGGCSVLADLYLLSGAATKAEERFAFGYGVFLQLMDDLQDLESDRAAGHQTLFTRAASRGPLDEPTARLGCFIDRVLERTVFLPKRRPAAAVTDTRDLIRRNCQTLLVGAVAEQPRRFTRRFRRTVERQWPFGFRAMRRLRRRAQRRYSEAARTLERQRGARSILDLVLEDAGNVADQSV
jgi:hypothetical protein